MCIESKKHGGLYYEKLRVQSGVNLQHSTPPGLNYRIIFPPVSPVAIHINALSGILHHSQDYYIAQFYEARSIAGFSVFNLPLRPQINRSDAI